MHAVVEPLDPPSRRWPPGGGGLLPTVRTLETFSWLVFVEEFFGEIMRCAFFFSPAFLPLPSCCTTGRREDPEIRARRNDSDVGRCPRFAERHQFCRSADGRPDHCILMSPPLGILDEDPTGHHHAVQQAGRAAATALQILTLTKASNLTVDQARAPNLDSLGRHATLWVRGIPESVAKVPALLTCRFREFGRVISTTVRAV